MFITTVMLGVVLVTAACLAVLRQYLIGLAEDSVPRPDIGLYSRYTPVRATFSPFGHSPLD